MGALPNQHYCDRRITNVFLTNLRHHVVGILAIDKVVFITNAEYLGRKYPSMVCPSVDEPADSLLVEVAVRDENFPFDSGVGDRRQD